MDNIAKKQICYIFNDHLYDIKLYNQINDYFSLYIKLSVIIDNQIKIVYVPLVELQNKKASHIHVYFNNHEYALAFSI